MMLRRMLRRLVRFLVMYDQRTRTFESMKKEKHFYLGWAMFGTLFLAVSVLELSPHLSELPSGSRWLCILVFSAVIYLVNMIAAIFVDVATLRRELWFIKHRLGLPLDPKELEDVEAYEKWLEERLRGVEA